jgi:hypothetical protein
VLHDNGSAALTSAAPAGGKSYVALWANKLKASLIILATIDMIIAIITPDTYFRLGAFFRIGFFAANSSDVRRELYLLARVVPGLASLLLFNILNLTFFAFFGLVLFHDVKGAFKYFGTFGNSMWQLWVLQTTCNFPDVRTPTSAEDFHAKLLQRAHRSLVCRS